MRIPAVVLPLAFAAALTGCTETQPPTPAIAAPTAVTSEAQYNAAAEQLAAAFATTWTAKDGPGYGLAYWPDAELVDPSGAIWDGREAIAQTHVDLWKATGDTKATATVRRVRPLSPTLMVVDITAVITGFPAPPPGGSADAEGRVYSNLKHVVEMRGGEWKISASQNTFIPPPP
jgi:uncharacterized protein (TIGR02246 family)